MSEKTYVLQTAGFDARFPNTNQTKHCKTTSTTTSASTQRARTSPRASSSSGPTGLSARSAKWDEQIENGTFPASLKP
ncbi:hypothetical protein JCM24511_04975 [Saitozyma sp. JCM 24511]|nr:hypothetical protein JCM24511_04975 [Saitozyma sp. JCM 24511]